MFFVDVDYSKEIQKARLFVAKPNKQILSHIWEKFNTSLSMKLGNISELTFSIPHYVDGEFELEKNKHVNIIKEKMLIKVELSGIEEWFIVDEIAEDGDDEDIFNVTAFSLGFELSHKRIGYFLGEVLSLRSMTNELLKETNWSIGSIDARFEQIDNFTNEPTVKRTLEATDSNVLECILNVAEAFGAVVVWDTNNRTVSFKDLENIGSYKGLNLDYGRILKSINRTRTTDEMVTRLYIYGNEDLGIHSVNPTGQAYIEDFSFFMYPFLRDSNKNVLKSSHFMSDELCHALLNQSELIEMHSAQINQLTKNLLEKQTFLIKEQSTLIQLEQELLSIETRLDTAKASGDAELIASIEAERDAKANEKATQEEVVQDLVDEIDGINNQIEVLRNAIATQAGFTQELYEELNFYIIEREWRDDRYIDAQELYNDGLKRFEQLREPKVVLTVDIENLFEIVEEQYYWDKLSLGDLVKIRYPQMDIEYTAKIIEINLDFEDGSISVTIANAEKIGSEMDKIKEILYKSKTASTILNNKKYIWDKAQLIEDEVYRLINDEWDANKRKITAGVNNKIEIGSRGIIIQNPDFPNEVIIMQSGIVALSMDGGETWKTAIKPDGIVAERLVGNLIAGRNLIITNGSKTFTVDEDGVKIHGANFEIVNGLPESQIDPKATARWNLAEQNAKEYADDLKEQIGEEMNDLKESLDGFKDTVNNSFKDGIIESSEAIAISKYLNSLNAEKQDMDSRCDIIVTDSFLSTSVRQNLENSISAYSTAHNDLINAIDIAITDNKATAEEVEDVNIKFTLYSTALASLSEKLEKAIKDIETNRVKDLENKIDDKLKSYVDVTMYGEDLASIQAQIDGSITTWFYDYEPTLNNIPSSEWITDEEKNVHLGDLFYDTTTGYAYRFMFSNGVYSWTKITDSDVVKALQDAKNAQDVADNKRRVFVNTPIPPYDTGDLWSQGNNGDLMVCVTSRASGSYVSTDWEKATKYTDDSWAQQQINLVKQDFTDVNDRINNLKNFTDESFKDGVIDYAEREALRTHITQLNNEKADIDARYGGVIDDIMLDSTIKNNLMDAKEYSLGGYDKAHSDLLSAITTAINDDKITEAERTAVNTAFNTYKIKLSTLLTVVEQAIRNIEQAKADKALQDAKGHTDGAINTVEQKITQEAIMAKVTSSTQWVTQQSTITQTASKVSIVVGADDKIKASSIATSLTASADALRILSENIDLTGKVTFNALDSSMKSKANGWDGTSTTVTSWKTPNKTTINGGVIETGTISASSIKTDELEVGKNIKMGANAYISWSQVSGRPTSASDLGGMDRTTYIDANGIFTGKLNASNIITGSFSANFITTGTLKSVSLESNSISGATISGSTISGTTINGGTINSTQLNSVNIDTQGSVKIGQNLDMRGSKTKILFNDYSYIQDSSGTLNIYGGWGLRLRGELGTYLEGDVNFSNATSVNWGSFKPTAVFG